MIKEFSTSYGQLVAAVVETLHQLPTPNVNIQVDELISALASFETLLQDLFQKVLLGQKELVKYSN